MTEEGIALDVADIEYHIVYRTGSEKVHYFHIVDMSTCLKKADCPFYFTSFFAFLRKKMSILGWVFSSGTFRGFSVTIDNKMCGKIAVGIFIRFGDQTYYYLILVEGHFKRDEKNVRNPGVFKELALSIQKPRDFGYRPLHYLSNWGFAKNSACILAPQFLRKLLIV